MRVLILTSEYKPNVVGGLGIVASRLALELADRDYEITVISRASLQTDEQHDGVHVLWFPSHLFAHDSRRGHRTWPIDHYLDESRLPRPDIIHVHSVQMTELAARLKRTCHVPLVYTCHSLVCEEEPSRLRTRLAAEQRRLLVLADRVVVPSAWQLADLRRHYPTSATRAVVIPNGVDLPPLEQLAANPEQLLCVGRLVPQKGMEQLLAAIPLLRRYRPDVRLTIVGSGPRRYMRRLQRMAGRPGIRDHVHWIGKREHWLVQLTYQLYGAVIVPSRRESFGLVALEALASGVPLVSTRSGGLSAFVSPSVASVIRGSTARAIARAVLRVWRNPGLARARAERGREIAARYGWDTIATRYDNLFVSLYRRSRSVDG